MEEEFYGTIRYGNKIMYEFHTKDISWAIAKITRLIPDEFPYAIGEVKNTVSGQLVYECHQRAIC